MTNESCPGSRYMANHVRNFLRVVMVILLGQLVVSISQILLIVAATDHIVANCKP